MIWLMNLQIVKMTATTKVSPQLMIAIGSTAIIVIVVFFAMMYSKRFQTAAKSTKDLLDITSKIQNENMVGDGGNDDEFDYSKLMGGGDSSGMQTFVDGTTEKYEWNQSEDEIEMRLPLGNYGEGITANEVDVVITSRRLKVVVRRKVVLDDEFYDTVRGDDCCWFLDKASQEITINLEKSVVTPKANFWTCVLKGDNKAGPSIHHLDANDPDSVAAAIKKVTAMCYLALSWHLNWFYFFSFLPLVESAKMRYLKVQIIDGVNFDWKKYF